MEHIYYEDENTQYIGLCPVTKEDGTKTKIYDGAQNWEIALVVQSFCSTDLINEYGPTIERAHRYIKNAQVYCSGSSKIILRIKVIGFAIQQKVHGHCQLQITAGARVIVLPKHLRSAILMLSKFSPSLVGEPMEKDRVHDTVDFLLSLKV
uniref:Uncharacterized protein n=1 Tax=Oryza punctata TaxID=4537 RepID=A0A0E0LBN1_ORYPU